MSVIVKSHFIQNGWIPNGVQISFEMELHSCVSVYPFLEPTRVSVGLTVNGLSENIRNHIFFLLRRAFRVIVCRPASICLDMI